MVISASSLVSALSQVRILLRFVKSVKYSTVTHFSGQISPGPHQDLHGRDKMQKKINTGTIGASVEILSLVTLYVQFD